MKFATDRIDNENATALLEQGLAAVQGGDVRVDLEGIRHCDSAAVALLLALRRAAQAAGRELDLVGVPASIANLAGLYGVEDLLPGVGASPATLRPATPG